LTDRTFIREEPSSCGFINDRNQWPVSDIFFSEKAPSPKWDSERPEVVGCYLPVLNQRNVGQSYGWMVLNGEILTPPTSGKRNGCASRSQFYAGNRL